MTDFYATYPATGGGGGGGGSVPTYTNLASFPSAVTAGNGALAIALDTNILYESNGTTWLVLADPAGAPGAAITALTGDVTAMGPGSVPATIANLAVTNAKIANSTIDLTAKVTGVLPFANGGTGQSSYTDGQLLIGKTSTTGLAKATLTAGTGITVTNGSGTITIASTGASATLTNTHIYVGNGSNVATDVALSGDATLANTGALTIANLAVTNAKIANATIDLTAKVTGVLPFANGGTGQSAYTDGQLLIGNTSTGGISKATLTAGTGITVTNGNGSITLASTGISSTLTNTHILVGNGSNVATDVALSGDATLANTGALTIANLAVTNAKIANSTIDLTAKVTGVLPFANGGTGQSSYTDGQLLIGNTSTGGISKATLTAGSNVTITNGNGSITIASTGGGSSTLTNTHIFVGNGSNVATDVAMSGDATMANTGALTIANLAVTNAKIANSTIDLTAKVTGVLPFANGGTGQSSYTDGQLLIGNTSTGGISKNTITAGTGITVTNGNGTITLAATGTGALTNTHIFVGNGSNVATDVALSGDATLANTGALTIANLAVTNAKIANSTIDLTAKVTGVLPFANGGTGQSSYTDGQLLIGNTSTGGISKATLTAGSNITITNGNGSITIASTGGGGGGANCAFNVNQVAHGFSVGSVIYCSGGTTFAAAKADALSTALVIGVVSVVIGANDFTMVTTGQITGLSGLTAGTEYYLSTSSAGAVQSTAPVALGQYVVGVYTAYSTTAAVINPSPYPTLVAQNNTFTNLTGNTTLTSTTANMIHTADSSGGAFTITLPAANAQPAGRQFRFKETTGSASTNVISIAPNGTDKIENLNVTYLWRTNFGDLSLVSDGSANWWFL